VCATNEPNAVQIDDNDGRLKYSPRSARAIVQNFGARDPMIVDHFVDK